MAGLIGVTRFGATSEGGQVQRIVLRAGELTVGLLTYGSILHSVRLDGVAHDLTLGSDVLADYEAGMQYHGALVGPVANRISDARARIAGQVHRFEETVGTTTLHSGATGIHRQVWRLAEVTEDTAILTLELADGLGGFPGNRRLTARWTVLAPATLRLDLTATTSAPTLMNIANHSYWNLDGSETWVGHRLRVAADTYLPLNADCLPTGEIAPVAGTDLDLRAGAEVRPGYPNVDHNFCLAKARGPLRQAVELTGATGTTMTVLTTEPGVQIYDGRDAERPGRGHHEGLAIEPQGWPDAPNQPGFPSITLSPGEIYSQTTEWHFRAG